VSDCLQALHVLFQIFIHAVKVNRIEYARELLVNRNLDVVNVLNAD
jgi:hypothetical protein